MAGTQSVPEWMAKRPQTLHESSGGDIRFPESGKVKNLRDHYRDSCDLTMPLHSRSSTDWPSPNQPEKIRTRKPSHLFHSQASRIEFTNITSNKPKTCTSTLQIDRFVRTSILKANKICYFRDRYHTYPTNSHGWWREDYRNSKR